MSDTPKEPKTPAERQAAYRERGRQIAVVLRDQAAIAALERLEKEQGGVTAALTYALAYWARKSRR